MIEIMANTHRTSGSLKIKIAHTKEVVTIKWQQKRQKQKQWSRLEDNKRNQKGIIIVLYFIVVGV
jgi:hypothetical protein